MSSRGTVKFFNMRKGYGFVTQEDTQSDLFVHTTDVTGEMLKEGDQVTFDVGTGNDGRNKAVNVKGGTGGEKQDQQQNRGFGGGFGGRNQGGDQGGRFGGYGGDQGGYGGNSGGYGGNSGGYGNSYGGNSGGYGGNSGGFGGKNKICYNFRDHGTCRFGDQCRFLHETN